jgi:hypothetical protein
MDTYPKVVHVQPISGKRLRVVFSDGSVKIYDCAPLLDEPGFRPLRDEAFFRNVRLDAHGFGVIWNDDIDLAESELWLQGIPEDAAKATPLHS